MLGQLKVDWGTLSKEDLESKYQIKYNTLKSLCCKYKFKSNRDHSKNPCCPVKYTKIRDMEEDFIKDWIEGVLTEEELIEKYECPYTNIATRARVLNIVRNRLKDKIDIQELKKDYLSKMLVKDIIVKYNISESTLLDLLPNEIIKYPGEGSRRYELNEHYFDNIDTEIKAYYLGLFYADGTNSIDRGTIGITLQEKDKYIIERLFKELDYNRPIFDIYNKKYDRIYSMGQISSRYLSNKFLEYGCMANKSFKIRFPNWLDENLISHFIRGYFDGDGCLSFAKKQPFKSSVGFAGNYEFLCELQKILVEKCKINLTQLHKKGNIYDLVVGGRYQLSRVLQYIYKNATIYLHRKYNKMQRLVELNIVNLEDVSGGDTKYSRIS